VQTSYGLGWRDLGRGVRHIGMAYWLAQEDMRSRYSRTALGPWWQVIGSAALVASLGLTFGIIMKQPMQEFLPYLAAGTSIWGLIQSLISDSPSVFTRNAGIITVYPLPITLHAFRQVVDKLILLFYALSVYAVLSAIFLRVPTLALAYFPLALIVYSVFGVGCALTFGVWGARYRDLSPALSSLMTLAFILTPVFWQKSAIESHPWLALGNPFYHLLEVGRGPLMGYAPDPLNWIVASGTAVGMLALGMVTFTTGRKTLLYWV
jgi:ABC-type polysaccharide/polyol phosphate export permease